MKHLNAVGEENERFTVGGDELLTLIFLGLCRRRRNIPFVSSPRTVASLGGAPSRGVTPEGNIFVGKFAKKEVGQVKKGVG